jgi:NAD(P)-dependent dehydrogenase (short-subunit alcohol dehydrogenase family)
MLLDGRVAVVTGSGQGIGRGYAFGLARAGARIVVAEVNEDTGAAVAKELEADGHEAMFVATDVSSETSTADMAAAATDRFGGVDILVNNAAIFQGLPFESIEEMPLERWNRVLAVNLTGIWLTTRALLPAIRARGGGAVVNQTSTAAYLCNPNRLHYNVSKAAVIPMTKAMARELAADNIRVNAIAPGPVGTEALAGVPEALLEKIKEAMCVKRIGEPDDLVGALLFLVSDMSAWMSGQVLVVDGGSTMAG